MLQSSDRPAFILTGPSEVTHRVAPTMRLNEQEETGRIIEMQRLEIKRLREQIQEQEQVPGLHTIGGVRLPSLGTRLHSFARMDAEVPNK